MRRLAVRVRDYAWILGAQLASPLWDWTAWDDGAGAPVVMIPGVYERCGVMASLAPALHEAGHPVHRVPALKFNASGLDDSATEVAARIRDLDLDRVVLVAHSKGGLIGKIVMNAPVVSDRVAGMVTIGTPFAGSSMARWFPTRAVRQLATTDRRIVELADMGGHERIVSLSPAFDPHIPEGSTLADALNITVPIDGHFRVLGDRQVHAQVVQQVERLVAAAG